eukprot:1151787-Pelagomonas_calceolata.AAC.3
MSSRVGEKRTQQRAGTEMKMLHMFQWLQVVSLRPVVHQASKKAGNKRFNIELTEDDLEASLQLFEEGMPSFDALVQCSEGESERGDRT